MPTALGIETSCDDCSVSIVKENGEVLFLSTRNQDETHKASQGVVPELASRRHEEQLLPLIAQALQKVPLTQIDLIACTNRPGLLGSLLVGCVTAKTLSLTWNKALIGVNHLEAHVFSSALFRTETKKEALSFEFPALAFVVSGGHSSLFHVEDIGKAFLIAQTRDDAAGEAFDKFARMLGYSWPGGVTIDKLSQKVKNKTYKKSFFTKIKTDDLSFSFSGIKSQAQRLLANKPIAWLKENKLELCTDFQSTVVDHLMEKFESAFKKQNYNQVLVGGGVSANSLFRSRLKEWSQKTSVPCFFPNKEFCTDNGAMIGFTGLQYFLKGKTDDLSMPCSPCNLEKDFFIKKYSRFQNK